MIRLIGCVFLTLCAILAIAQSPAKIKAGDVLTVVTANQPQYSGDFLVASDGTIEIQVFGRFAVVGKDVPTVQREVQKRAREYVRDAVVSVILKQEAQQFVYLVSEKVSEGAVPWMPGMRVRQLIAHHPALDALDNYSAKLYSGPSPAVAVDLVKLVRDGSDEQNFELKPGDVLALLPSGYRPVWVVGSVARPGQYRLHDGDGALQAVAFAGGVNPTSSSPGQVSVTLRRGSQTWSRLLADIDGDDPWKLEPGDTLVVSLPKTIRVTVGGFVRKAGDVQSLDGAPVLSVIESSGGVNEAGSLERVLVFRKGDVYAADLRSVASGGKEGGQSLMDGDFVYVGENKRVFHVFGFVNKPGVKAIPDGRTFHMADALASGEGLNPRGTYRRAVILRPGPDGKYAPQKFDFDKYIKGGDPAQNPEVVAGDIVFFDQASASTLQSVLQILPNLILVSRLF